MAAIIPIKGAREAPRAQQNKMETVIISIKQVEEWRHPPFQRPLSVNAKVREVAEKLKHSESIEGVLTLGKVGRDPTIYIVDGQHRIEAFKISGLTDVFADLRVITFDSLADMADEFVRLNSSLVRMRPDDILRGLEASVPALQRIRQACGFVGYDQIRRGSRCAPVLSMSGVMRCWHGSAGETPAANGAGQSAQHIATTMDDSGVSNLIAFLSIAHAAWGRDPEYFRLWGNLNLTMCMWLWRRLVIERDRGTKRYIVLTAAQFKNCLMSLSTSTEYLSWLVGRNLHERDRAPCYTRIKPLFIKRIMQDAPSGKKPIMPAPPWATK